MNTKPVMDMTTPDLVREFAAIREASVLADGPSPERHYRLCAVVDELRRRNVLD